MATEKEPSNQLNQNPKRADPYQGRDPREIPAYSTFEAARYLRIPESTR
jgi:hypothetical protein